MQTPPQHPWFAAQTMPHPPQLSSSDEKSGLIASPCAACAATALSLTSI